MDLALMIAIVGTGLAMVGVVISMMFWVRTESNSLRSDAKEDRKDMLNMVRAIEMEIKDFHTIVNDEMKDFHYKLLEIERKR